MVPSVGKVCPAPLLGCTGLSVRRVACWQRLPAVRPLLGAAELVLQIGRTNRSAAGEAGGRLGLGGRKKCRMLFAGSTTMVLSEALEGLPNGRCQQQPAGLQELGIAELPPSVRQSMTQQGGRIRAPPTG